MYSKPYVIGNNGLEREASSFGMGPRVRNSDRGNSRQWLPNLMIIGGPILVCISLLLLFTLTPGPQPKAGTTDSSCIISAEAKRSNLMETLKKIETSYFHILYPENIFVKSGATPEEIRQFFRPWDPTPASLKSKTDEANTLRAELIKLKINRTLLKLRERKAIYVAKQILLNNFGWTPFIKNYYIGDWMLGPDLFCWQPICDVFYNLNAVISAFKPRNVSDLRKLDHLFQQHNHTFARYIDNLKLGVRTGFVRQIEACRAGIHDMHYLKYRNIFLYNESGVYKEQFSKTIQSTGFFDQLSEDDNKTWKEETGQDVLGYFNRSLLTYIGKPAIKMLRYVEGEHLRNCPPDTLDSGLQKLPLEYVYEYPNGLSSPGNWNTNLKTLKKLPTGEELKGTKGYESFMRFYTTFEITPEQLRERARARLNDLYNSTMDLVKEYTGLNDDTKARDKFISEIQRQDRYFNRLSFPSGESDEKAFIKCFDADSAKKHCPKRWEAMQTWIKSTQKVKDQIKPLLKDLLYDDGPKNCIPKCPMDVIPWFHGHAVFQYYIPGSKDCSVKATQGLPFFTANYGPNWTEYTTTVHEFAGHHVEVQSYNEYFRGECSDPIGWLSTPNYFTAITEGWASYNEYELFPNYTTLYSFTSSNKATILRQKYGMLYFQILYALRTLADIDLNYYGTPTSTVRKMYRQYLWEDNSHQVKKDIIRLQSLPGFATSYMIGQIKISEMKALAKKELGEDFSLKDFHYEVLREGEFPLDNLEEHMKYYIACKKNPQDVGCEEFL